MSTVRLCLHFVFHTARARSQNYGVELEHCDDAHAQRGECNAHAKVQRLRLLLHAMLKLYYMRYRVRITSVTGNA